jgi:hypothetical protein
LKKAEKFKKIEKQKMFNCDFLVLLLLLGLLTNVGSMSLKRSEKSDNNLEKVDDTEYPMKVNYDVYPVSLCQEFNRCDGNLRRPVAS